MNLTRRGCCSALHGVSGIFPSYEWRFPLLIGGSPVSVRCQEQPPEWGLVSVIPLRVFVDGLLPDCDCAGPTRDIPPAVDMVVNGSAFCDVLCTLHTGTYLKIVGGGSHFGGGSIPIFTFLLHFYLTIFSENPKISHAAPSAPRFWSVVGMGLSPPRSPGGPPLGWGYILPPPPRIELWEIHRPP